MFFNRRGKELERIMIEAPGKEKGNLDGIVPYIYAPLDLIWDHGKRTRDLVWICLDIATGSPLVLGRFTKQWLAYGQRPFDDKRLDLHSIATVSVWTIVSESSINMDMDMDEASDVSGYICSHIFDERVY